MSIENTHFGPARIRSYLGNRGSVYFIGIGGVMMSSLALLTARMGFSVSGSDRSDSDIVRHLREAGITVHPRHDGNQIPADTCLVVYTVAISPDNPEWLAAGERHIPTVSRADYLGALMTHYRRRIGIAGMHGKSTTTSMCAQIFMDAEADPTILSGADYAPMGGAYRLGGEEHFIFEACEYMDSFLDFRPTVAVLLGAEWEHVDYFRSMTHIRRSFARFASLTGPDGVTVVNADDSDVMIAARGALNSRGTGHLVTFGLEPSNHPDFTARHLSVMGGCPRFDLVAYGETLGTVQLTVPGRHQVYNALASAAAATVAGIDPAAIVRGLSRFSGAGRRMEYKGDLNGAPVYDDYGHHPTEVRATLEGARALMESRNQDKDRKGRLICVFQPHTYSRTAELYGQFLTAFDAADLVLFPDIYAARETNTYGVSTEQIARDLNRQVPGKALYCPAVDDIVKHLQSTARPEDLLVIMGAGDVIRVTKKLFP